MRVLECPVCREPMIAVECGDVEADTCVECGGVWLDGGELEALVGSAVPAKAQPEASLGPPDRDCPICVHKLIKDRYGSTQVVVDKCPHGDGIWLDKGELEQILATAAPTPGKPADHEAHGAAALRNLFDARPPQPPNPEQ